MSKTKCNHLWSYVHAVYGGPKGGTLVRRYCSLCPKEQVGIVERWRDPHPDEFSETAKEVAEKTSMTPSN